MREADSRRDKFPVVAAAVKTADEFGIEKTTGDSFLAVAYLKGASGHVETDSTGENIIPM